LLETLPNIPPKANRRWKNCFSPFLYRDRNAIERMFGQLKDFRRIAIRCDRSATNFLAAGKRFLAASSRESRGVNRRGNGTRIGVQKEPL
jgi:transposase